MTSNINPNNIDGAYPVAGQDNNSQGFRDNFTNTKTNFAYAAAEITDLQNKAILKAALTGGTLNNNMNGVVLSNAQLQEMSETVVALGTVNGSFTVDYSAGSYQTLTTAGPVSLNFSNFTPAGTADYVEVQITVTDVAHTLQLPSAVGYGSSSTSEIGIQGLDIGTNTITFSATGTYVYSFATSDSGTTVYINDLTQARSSFSGNVTLGNVAVTATTQANSTTTGAVTVAGGVGIAGNLYVGGNIVGNIEINNIESIVGNVTAGNLLTSGLVSATGNITGGNIIVTSNIILNGSDIKTSQTTANLFQTSSTTINIGNAATTINVGATGGNVNVAGNTITTGNVLGGNITTTGLVSATGNITSGNVNTGNISLSGNVVSDLNVSGNIAGGNVILTGASYPAAGMHSTGPYLGANTDGITVDYISGNGRISVGPSDGINFYNSNVANVLLASISSGGAFSATGNIVGNNINSTTTFSLAVFANATVRDSSISSPVPGMMVYVTGTGMQVYGATQWNTVAGTGT